MSRIRSIKPEFWTSEAIATVSRPARLTFVGLWNYCDDHGRGKDSARLIRTTLYPYDDDLGDAEVAEHLDELAAAGRIVRYTVAGKGYIVVPRWHEHQKPTRRAEPRHPGPDEADPEPEHVPVSTVAIHNGVDNPPAIPSQAGKTDMHCMRVAYAVPERGVVEGDGAGRGTRERPPNRPAGRPARSCTTPPPRPTGAARPSTTPSSAAVRPRCALHEHLDPDDFGPPCWACRDARLTAETNAATVALQAAAERETRRAARENCPSCHGDNWITNADQRPVARCTHDFEPDPARELVGAFA